MKKISSDMELILQSDCAHSIEDVINNKKKKDYNDLLAVVESDSAPEQYRSKALYILGRWGDKAAVSTIEKSLPTLDEVGRISAIDALSRLDSKESLARIMALSEDASPYVRKFVAQSLKKVKNTDVSKLLTSMKAKENVEFVRHAIEN